MEVLEDQIPDEPEVERQAAGVPAIVPSQERAMAFDEEQIAAFQRSFQKYYFDLGGREREIQFIDELDKRQRASGRESPLSSALSSYTNCSSLFPPQSDSKFQELYPGADSAAVTWLSRQENTLASWLKQPAGQRSLPVDAMSQHPLAYSPDMWFAYGSKRDSSALTPQARQRIASMRDQFVLEDAWLVGEQFVMLPSIQAAQKEALPETVGRSLSQVLCLLLPEWESIERARRDLQMRYFRALQTEFMLLE